MARLRNVCRCVRVPDCCLAVIASPGYDFIQNRPGTASDCDGHGEVSTNCSLGAPVYLAGAVFGRLHIKTGDPLYLFACRYLVAP